MHLRSVLLAAASVLVLAAAPRAAPQVGTIPKTIHYQGVLSHPDGRPVDGVLSMRFQIYDELAGGAPLWSERHPAVDVIRGRFNVELGSIEPFDAVPLEFDRPYFLAIAVDEDEEMSPRVSLTSVAYALRSAVADRATRAERADEADHAATADSATNADRAALADRALMADVAGHAATAGLAAEATRAVRATDADHADEATHAETADVADLAARATRATDADHADEATHAETADLADLATRATRATDADHADEATHAETADVAALATRATRATDADHADEATHAETADVAALATRATNADHADEADHCLDCDHATEADHALTADLATVATRALSADAANSAEADHALAADHALQADRAARADYALGIQEARHAVVSPELRSGDMPAAGMGRYATVAAALADRAAWCPSPTAEARCLLELSAGDHELGATLVLPAFVTLSGAGPRLTRLVPGGSLFGTSQPMVAPEHDSEIRLLAIDTLGIAAQPALRVALVTVAADFGLLVHDVASTGPFVLTNASAMLRDVAIESGSATASLTLTGATVAAERARLGNSVGFAVSCGGCSLTMRGGTLASADLALDDTTTTSSGVRIRLEQVEVDAFRGLYLKGSNALVSSVTFTSMLGGTTVEVAGNGGATLLGVVVLDPDASIVLDSAAQLHVQGSRVAGTIEAAGGTVFVDGSAAGDLVATSGGLFLVSHSKIASATGGAARFKCVGVLDAATYDLLDGDCL